MGAANVIPGVSGGFIAFILGFYEKLIHSLKKINYSAFSKLSKEGIRSFSDHINGSFLIFIFLGVIFSYFSVSLCGLIKACASENSGQTKKCF